MRSLLIVTIAGALAAIAAPLAAQQAAQPPAADYDQAAVVTLEGTADTIEWASAGGKLVLLPTAGPPMWDVALPNTDVLLKKGVSANNLTRGVSVKVRAYKAKDAACNPNCKAQGIELVINGGQAIDLLSAVPPDPTPPPPARGRRGG